MLKHFAYLDENKSDSQNNEGWIYRLYTLIELDVIDWFMAFQSTNPKNVLDKYRRLQEQGQHAAGRDFRGGTGARREGSGPCGELQLPESL